MLKASVGGARENILREAQLPDSAQALIGGMIDYPTYHRVETNVPVDFVSNDPGFFTFSISGHIN